MDTDVKRGLGIALAGLLAWALAAVTAQALGDGTGGQVAYLTLGLVALVGLVAILGGLAWVAWSLIRR